MNEASEHVIGKTYLCVTSPYDPPVKCVLDKRGVFMPVKPTYQLFERIYGIYEYERRT
jgi:hypothetical protein